MMSEECHREFSECVQCVFCISWCILPQDPRTHVLHAPLSYKERKWLVCNFRSTGSVVAGDGIYMEWMELSIFCPRICILRVGYYQDVLDVYLDIYHTSADDRRCSKIRNNIHRSDIPHNAETLKDQTRPICGNLRICIIYIYILMAIKLGIFNQAEASSHQQQALSL